MAQYLFRINFPLTIFLQQHGDSLSINELSAKRQHLPIFPSVKAFMSMLALIVCISASTWLARLFLKSRPKRLRTAASGCRQNAHSTLMRQATSCEGPGIAHSFGARRFHGCGVTPLIGKYLSDIKEPWRSILPRKDNKCIGYTSLCHENQI